MQADRIRQRLGRGGFEQLQADTLPCDVWIRRGENLQAVCLFPNAAAFREKPAAFRGLLQRVCETLCIQSGRACSVLALVVSSDIAADRVLADENGFGPVWLTDPSGNLVIFDNQPGSFYGVESLLQAPGKSGERKRMFPDFFPWATVSLAALNLLIQLAIAVQSGYSGGSFWGTGDHSSLQKLLELPVILFTEANPPWYRLFTAAFTHYGWRHFLNNMLVLLFLGKSAERYAGRIYFLASYLISAVAANGVSVLWYIMQNQLYVRTAGASGAVFSIAGMLLALLLLSRKSIAGVTPRQLIFMLVFTVYNGVAEQGVNNCAHIAGAAAGFCFGVVLILSRKFSGQRSKN